MILICPLELDVCSQVARLHLEYLATFYRGLPGQRLLTLYYQAVLEGKGACGYTAAENGQVAGFVCGIWDPQTLRSVRRKHWPGWAGWGLAQIVRHPSTLASGLRALAIQSMTRRGNPEQEGGYELRPIVVAPWARGSGVAAALVETLCQDADRRGFRSIYLHVDPDNTAAHRLYEKTGFYVLRTGFRSGKSTIIYEKKLCDPL